MSKIEWTDETWNPVGGCSIKSPGCGPCYAQKLAGTRLRNHPIYRGVTTVVKGKHLFNGKMTAAAEDHPVWTWPLRWRGARPEKRRLGPDKPSLIFVGDMSDLFHESRRLASIDRAIAAVTYSRHIGQLLTKRPEVMASYFIELESSGRWRKLAHPQIGRPNWAPEATFTSAIVPRLWPGASAERQKEFDERWPYLRQLAALGFVVFFSYEPALGPLVLPADFLARGRRVQVIAGGMSGNEAVPAHPQWFRDVRDQCRAAGVPFFFKQWGEYRPCRVAQNCGTMEVSGPGVVPTYWPDGTIGAGKAELKGGLGHDFERVGKKAAGRLLDGEEHSEWPEVRP